MRGAGNIIIYKTIYVRILTCLRGTNVKRGILIASALLILTTSLTAPVSHVLADTSIPTRNTTVTEEMTDEQLSSIAMLNHLTVLTQEINASQNNKVYLENAYSAIVNNINKNAPDEDSLAQINMLLNTIHGYQMIDVKRDRIQYIYEQNQAQALKHAIPNPIALLSTVASGNYLKAAASAIYMAVDSVESYKEYATQTELKYLEDGWKLDDEAAEALHESRRDAFNYMVTMCQKYDLSSRLALNEQSVNDFVKWENNSSVIRRIEFLEKNIEDYQAYGKYWLVLAQSYYENNEYQKCIDAVETYESMGINIFEHNYELANALPMVLVSAENLLENGEITEEEYIDIAKHVTSTILDNIVRKDGWALRYFVAQTYVDLAAKTKDDTYLAEAYDLALENINYLIDEQQVRNEAYLAEIVKVKEEEPNKKEKKQYNKWMAEERKIELPPVYAPLVLNCDLLFALAPKLDLSRAQKDWADSILHSNDSRLFLIDQIEQKYWFTQPDSDPVEYSIEVNTNATEFKIPASILPHGAKIKVTVTDGDAQNVYEDWTVEKVTRKTEGDINTFVAVCSSKAIKDQDYSEQSKIKLEIIPEEKATYPKYSFYFNLKSYRKVGPAQFAEFEIGPNN